LYDRTISLEADSSNLQANFVALVRSLGLLRPDTTPCGEPMSISEAHAIGELRDCGSLTQRELAQRLRLQKSTVSRLIDELERRRLVRRTSHPDDGRSVLIDLTSMGRRRAERLAEARQALFSRLLAEIAPAERRAVVRSLARLTEAARALA
jgi:DNA-binding MarR family transcriptional regulator